jgi:hypothetical protein
MELAEGDAVVDDRLALGVAVRRDVGRVAWSSWWWSRQSAHRSAYARVTHSRKATWLAKGLDPPQLLAC